MRETINFSYLATTNFKVFLKNKKKKNSEIQTCCTMNGLWFQEQMNKHKDISADMATTLAV